LPRISFSPLALKALKAPAPLRPDRVSQIDYFDESTPGFGLRISSKGIRSWFVMDRIAGKVVRITLGRFVREADAGGLSLSDARQMAGERRKAIKRGEDPRGASVSPDGIVTKLVPCVTFQTVASEFIEKYAKQKTKSWPETERNFARLVTPVWGAKDVKAITRRDVIDLLARVAEENGPIMANRVLSATGKMFNWWQIQDASFTTPIVRGMAPGTVKERDRVLTDPEIPAVWANVAGENIYGPILKILLLTMSRREEVAGMRESELDENGPGGPVWTIPGDRTKNGKQKVVPLSPAAWAIISAQPRWKDCPFVFSPDGKNTFRNYGRKKEQLDKKLGAMPAWVIHDLRRTGRTIMASLHIDERIAELCLGHTIAGVEGTYNRYAYLDEKRDALNKLAQKIKSITE
jgi:integrase